MRRLLTPDDAAELLRVTPKVIRQWLREGRIPGVRLGRLWRIHPEELEQAVRAGFGAGKPLPAQEIALERETQPTPTANPRTPKKRAQARSMGRRRSESRKPRSQRADAASRKD